MPETGTVFGREREMAQLKNWILEEGCKCVAVLGMGGMGKTTLAASMAHTLSSHFDEVIWISLLNAPPLESTLRTTLQKLTPDSIPASQHSFDEQLSQLISVLQQRRCLIVLDNLESILHSEQTGVFRSGYEGYGQLMQRIIEQPHRSSLLFTSREQPNELARLGADASRQTLRLAGLPFADSLTMLSAQGMAGPEREVHDLVQRYSGNPLALKLVSQTVQELFSGDLGEFLAADALIFDDIRAVLDQQYARLTSLERELLIWLAIEREPITVPALRANLVQARSPREFMEALRSLQRRSLLESSESKLSLQNVILEYVTERLIEGVCDDVLATSQTGDPFNSSSLHRYAMLKTTAKDYVRQSQLHTIMVPIATRLVGKLGKDALVQRLRQMIEFVRGDAQHRSSYAAGNIINLLVHVGANLGGMDFSGMSIWQAWLRGADLQGVNFTGADLSNSVFTDRFAGVRGLTFSQDGQLFAGGGSDGDIYVWQTHTGQLVGVLKGHKQLVLSLSFGRDASSRCPLLVSGGEDGTVRLWDVSDWLRHAEDLASSHRANSVPITSTVLHRGEAIVRAVSFHAGLGLVASGGDDDAIRLWRIRDIDQSSPGNTFACAALRGHTYIVTSLAFSPNGQWLASTSGDHTVRLWDISAAPIAGATPITLNTSITVLESPEGAGETDTLAYSPDGALLAGITTDRQVWLWQPSLEIPGAPVTFLDEANAHTGALAFSPDGTLLAIGNIQGIIALRDNRTGTVIYRGQLQDDKIASLAFSPDGHTLASVTGTFIKLWDSVAHLPLRTLKGITLPFSDIALSTDGNCMVTLAGDWLVRIWDIALEGEGERTVIKRRCRLALPGHIDGMWGCAITRAGNRVASCSEDRTIRIWDRATGQCLHVLRGHAHSVIAAAFSPDGDMLASASLDQTVQLWNVQTGEPVARLMDAHMLQSIHNGIWSVRFSPNGRTLAAGFGDGSILLWDVASRELRATLRGHTAWVRSLAFSADGAWLASGSNDQLVCVWNITEPSLSSAHLLRHTIHAHTAWVMAVAFHPTQPILATAGHDRTIRVWDIGNKADPPACIAVLQGHQLGVTSMAFHARGDVLVSAGQDEQLMFWDYLHQHCLDSIHAPGPYSGMKIAGAVGMSEAQRAALQALGASTE